MCDHSFQSRDRALCVSALKPNQTTGKAAWGVVALCGSQEPGRLQLGAVGEGAGSSVGLCPRWWGTGGHDGKLACTPTLQSLERPGARSPQIPLDTHCPSFSWRPWRGWSLPRTIVLQDEWTGHRVRVDGGESLRWADPVAPGRDQMGAEGRPAWGLGVRRRKGQCCF